MKKYKPIDSLKSPRFAGVSTFMRLPNIATLEDVDFIVAGVPFDTGCTFRVGSRFGPKAIRDASVILKPYNPELNVDIFEYCSGVDYGDINISPGFIEDSYRIIEEALIPVFDHDIIPICMGGDHSITLPELRAAAKVKGPVALIHFDSHSDTLDSFFGQIYNHGTSFRRAVEERLLLTENSIQIGLRGPIYAPQLLDDARQMGFELLTACEMRKIGLEETIKRIRERVGDKPAFVTFDIDFLDAAYAPGTGTPEIGGFTTWEAQKIVRESLVGLNIIGYDLVEVLPSYDPSQITSFAAAGIMHEFLSLIALHKKQKLHQ